MSFQSHHKHADKSPEWQKIEGEVRQRWQELSDDDLEQAGGSVHELVGVIQRKTGEAREQIESFMAGFMDEIGPTVERAREAATQYSKDAADALQEQYDRAAGRLKQGYAQAQATVRRKPAQAVAVAFGAGLLAGILVSSVLSSRDR